MMFVLSCIHVNHLCILYLYYFLVVVHRGPHGRLAFFLLNVLPSENKDYYYYYYYYYIGLYRENVKKIFLSETTGLRALIFSM